MSAATDRIAIHRRIRPRRQRDPRGDGLGHDPPERVGRGDAFRADRLGNGEDRVARLLDAQQPRRPRGALTSRVPAPPPGRSRAAAAAVRPAPSPGDERHDRATIAMITTPTTSAVSSQNWNGKSWTSRSVVGSNRYDPAGKKIWWKMLEQLVEGDQPDDAERRPTPTVSPSAPPRTARHVRARSRRAAGRDEHDDRGDGQDPQPAEHRPDIDHVRPLPLIEHRRPVDRDGEVAAEHEVGQDRVGRRAQLLGREPGPRRGLARDPARTRPTAGVRNGRIATATMTIAVATADRERRGAAARGCSRANRSPSRRGPVGPYSSSSVLAWSHQPSSRRVGRRRPRRARRRRDGRARRTPAGRGRGCRAVLRSAPGSSAGARRARSPRG